MLVCQMVLPLLHVCLSYLDAAFLSYLEDILLRHFTQYDGSSNLPPQLLPCSLNCKYKSSMEIYERESDQIIFNSLF